MTKKKVTFVKGQTLQSPTAPAPLAKGSLTKNELHAIVINFFEAIDNLFVDPASAMPRGFAPHVAKLRLHSVPLRMTHRGLMQCEQSE